MQGLHCKGSIFMSKCMALVTLYAPFFCVNCLQNNLFKGGSMGEVKTGLFSSKKSRFSVHAQKLVFEEMNDMCGNPFWFVKTFFVLGDEQTWCFIPSLPRIVKLSSHPAGAMAHNKQKIFSSRKELTIEYRLPTD